MTKTNTQTNQFWLLKSSAFIPQTLLRIHKCSFLPQCHLRLARRPWSRPWIPTSTAPRRRWRARSMPTLPCITSSGTGSWRKSAPTSPGEGGRVLSYWPLCISYSEAVPRLLSKSNRWTLRRFPSRGAQHLLPPYLMSPKSVIRCLHSGQSPVWLARSRFLSLP